MRIGEVVSRAGVTFSGPITVTTRVRTLAQAKLADVRQRITHLRAIEDVLAALVGNCCREDEPRCAILDALIDPSIRSTPSLR